jgi:WD repeat-containing protein 90
MYLSILSVFLHVTWHKQGNVGILDISTRNYTTVMRSHTGRILSVAVDKQHRHIATASDDHTIRIWDLDTLQQVSSHSQLIIN